jgi:adenylyltransferase/sulfurtransferase
MFRIVKDPILEPLLEPQVSAGGVVTFDGRVRDLNENRAVEALEYEAIDDLAVKEGALILAEARDRFAITAAACVHRVGRLNLGEIAIRVEVAAPHRRAAFDACEYIVDEVKRRVPIWKREHYADGTTDWIHAHGTHVLSEEGFYRRQIALREVGAEGQRKLSAGKVLVVGAGGLGCPAILYLAAAGVGRLGIADGDLVEPTNLHRQPLYRASDIGSAKVQLAAQRARSLNPYIDVREHPFRLTGGNAEAVLGEYDLVLDCTDNFRAKFLLNDLCVRLGRPLISASVEKFEGQLLCVLPGGPCMRCLWPQAPADGCVGSCEEDGVLGVVPGVMGTLQAGEAIKTLLEMPSSTGPFTLIDLRDLSTTRIALAKDPHCPACGRGLRASHDDLLVSDICPTDLVVDIREPYEVRAQPLRGAKVMPMSRFDIRDDALAEAERVILVCAKGVRSVVLARELRQLGFLNVFS